jgi:hypothetical protein
VATLIPAVALTDPRVPLAEIAIAMLVPLVLLLACTTAIAHVALQPFAWTVAMAAFWSLSLLWITGRGRILAMQLAIAAGLWLAVFQTVRVRRLLKQHPGTVAARMLLGVVADRDVDPVELRRLAVRAALKRSGIYAAVVLAGVAAAFAGAWFGLRPRPLGPALDAFTAAWNRSDVSDVVAFVEEREHATATRARLEKAREARGWKSLPRLQPPSADLRATLEGDPTVELRFEDGDESLRCSWRRSGTGWALARLELPLPPFAAVLERFERAWNAGDAARLVELFIETSETSRPRFRAYLEQLADKRGWTAGFPRVLSSEHLPVDSRTVDVWLRTEGDRFRTRWWVDEDDRWVLVTLDPPK